MKRTIAISIIPILLAALVPARAEARSKTALAIVGGLTLAGAALAAELRTRRTTMVTSRGVTSFPDLGSEASARPGEAIYANFNYDEVRVAKLTAPVQPIEYGSPWPAGTILYEMVNGKYCFPDGSKCFEDSKERGYFKKAGRNPRTQKIIDVPYSAETVRLHASDQGFRAELIYEGVGGGVLRLGYREFVDDMARPAFSQLITYDLAPGEPTIIAFQELTFNVLSANNMSIRYKAQTRQR